MKRGVSNEKIIDATSGKRRLSTRTSVGSANNHGHDVKVTIEKFVTNRKILPGTDTPTLEKEPTLTEILQKKSIEEAVKTLLNRESFKYIVSSNKRPSLVESETRNAILSIKEDVKNIYRRGYVKTQLNVEEIKPLDKNKGKKLNEEIEIRKEPDPPEQTTEIEDTRPVTGRVFSTETPTDPKKPTDRQKQLSFQPDVKIFDRENGDTQLTKAKAESLKDDKISRAISDHYVPLRSKNVKEKQRSSSSEEEEEETKKEDIVSVPHKLMEKKVEDRCDWRRQCGCLKTSDKLKQLLKRFPSPPPPPPTPATPPISAKFEPKSCISAYCTDTCYGCTMAPQTYMLPHEMSHTQSDLTYKQTITSNVWRMIHYLVNLMQLSVTTTALALYYIIYFYMHLIYYLLVSAMFFHNADGPMKITIGVVTVTSVIVGFNLLLRMERFVGISLNE